MSFWKFPGLSILCLCHSLFAQDESLKDGNGAKSVSVQFEAIVSHYFEESARLSPIWATSQGDHRYDSLIDDVSAKGRKNRLEFEKELLKQIEGLDKVDLSRDERVDLAILSHHLNASIWSHVTLQEWAWNPLLYSGLAGNAIYSLVARDFAPLPERLRSATARLGQLPTLLEQTRSALILSRVPRIHAETAIGQNRGVLNIIENTIQSHIHELGSKDRQDLTQTIDIARKAVEQHQQWLEDTLLPKAVGNHRLGANLYDQKLGQTLQSPLTRQQIKERGNQQIHTLRERMFEISREIYQKRFPYTEFPKRPSQAYKRSIIRTCLEFAYQDRPTADGVVAAANESVRLTTNFLRDNDIITLPEDPMEIIVMPEFRRGVSLAYCDSPGAMETGSIKRKPCG